VENAQQMKCEHDSRERNVFLPRPASLLKARLRRLTYFERIVLALTTSVANGLRLVFTSEEIKRSGSHHQYYVSRKERCIVGAVFPASMFAGKLYGERLRW
jgi:hypothetical protein